MEARSPGKRLLVGVVPMGGDAVHDGVDEGGIAEEPLKRDGYKFEVYIEMDALGVLLIVIECWGRAVQYFLTLEREVMGRGDGEKASTHRHIKALGRSYPLPRQTWQVPCL